MSSLPCLLKMYTFVVDCASSDYVKLTASGLPDMRYMKVYAGELTGTQHTVSETGDDTQRVITGITDKSYTVNGLTNGGTFYFYVVANYANGTLGESNTKQKRIRNIIYKVCGIGMFSTLILLVLPITFSAKIFIVEAIALTFFGVSWLVKGQFFGLLADK